MEQIVRLIFSLMVVLCFSSCMCQSQQLNMDSIVMNLEYSSKHLLKYKNKYELIDSLLKYEGDHRTNPTWKVSFTPIVTEGGRAAFYDRVTNQAVALYLIEAVLRNDFHFSNVSYFMYNETDRFDRLSLLGIRSLKDIPNLYIIDGKLKEEQNLINEEHFKEVYRVYKEWFANHRSIAFEQLSNEEKSPLKRTRYGWTIEEMERKSGTDPQD